MINLNGYDRLNFVK